MHADYLKGYNHRGSGRQPKSWAAKQPDIQPGLRQTANPTRAIPADNFQDNNPKSNRSRQQPAQATVADRQNVKIVGRQATAEQTSNPFALPPALAVKIQTAQSSRRQQSITTATKYRYICRSVKIHKAQKREDVEWNVLNGWRCSSWMISPAFSYWLGRKIFA